MKRSLVRLALALLWLGGFAEAGLAQTTAVSAPSGTIQIAGAPIASGTAVLLPVDIYDHPIAVTSSSGLSLPGSPAKPVGFSCSITAGAISGCSVPDEVAASPSGFRYDISVTDTASGKTFTLHEVPGITGATFRLDQYTPTVTVPAVATMTHTSGTGTPTGGCTEPADYFDKTGHALYECSNGAWVQVSGGSGGSGVTFPTGVLFGNNSPSAPTAANSAQIQSAIGSGVYDPAGAAAAVKAPNGMVFYSQSGDTISSIESECSSPCAYYVTQPQIFTLSGNHTLSANLSPIFLPNGKWTVSGGTLALSNPVTGSLTQHFFSNVQFAASQKLVPVEWFGAQGGTSLPSFDSTSAVQAAVNALTGAGAQVEYQAETYRQDGTVSFPSGIGLKGVYPGTQIVTTSATADQIHIFGADHAHLASRNVLQDFALSATVTRTGTAAGVYLDHTIGVIVRNCSVGQNVYNFHIHDSGDAANGGIEYCLATFSETDATQRVGWYLDSADGVCNCSLFMKGDGTVVSQNTGVATIYGTKIEGSAINDLVTINNGSAGTTTGLYIHYTGTGAFDSASDIHIVNEVDDNCGGNCIQVDSLPATGIDGGNVEINGGYASTPTSNSAILVQNSAGVNIHDTHVRTGANGVGVNLISTTNSRVAGVTMQNTSAIAGILLTGSSNNIITGNLLNFDPSVNFALIYSTGGSNHNAFIGNVLSGGGASAEGIGMDTGTAVGTSTNVMTTAQGCVVTGTGVC